MLLGRRKSGFTEEVSLRPSEIPDYVNEENDTTFRRPESSCLGDMQQEASEPQEWVPPPPMPMYRLLREFIRSQCEAAIITPEAKPRSSFCNDEFISSFMRNTKEEPTTVPKKGISIPNIIPSIVFYDFYFRKP